MPGFWLVFHVTDRCQLNCKHCLRDPEKSAHDLPVELMSRILDEGQSIYGCDHVGMTGGEPTLHPQFAQLVDAIVSRGMTWHVVTNGMRFGPRLVRLLDEDPRRQAAITAIDFSVDGATEETHDRIRGKGSYRELMKAVTLCRMREIPFMFQMTVNGYNQAEIESYAMVAHQLGASRVSFGMTQPTGTYLDQELYLSPSGWRKVADRIDRTSAAMTIPVTRTEGFQRDNLFHECEPFRSQILHVDYYGHMNLCCQHAGVPGEEGSSHDIADLQKTTLVEAHRRMLLLVQQFRLDKLARMEAGDLGEWDYFPCNYCLKYFEKQHWTDQGTEGPGAQRERWKGAWAPENHQGTTIEPARRALKVIA